MVAAAGTARAELAGGKLPLRAWIRHAIGHPMGRGGRQHAVQLRTAVRGQLGGDLTGDTKRDRMAVPL